MPLRRPLVSAFSQPSLSLGSFHLSSHSPSLTFLPVLSFSFFLRPASALPPTRLVRDDRCFNVRPYMLGIPANERVSSPNIHTNAQTRRNLSENLSRLVLSGVCLKQCLGERCIFLRCLLIAPAGDDHQSRQLENWNVRFNRDNTPHFKLTIIYEGALIYCVRILQLEIFSLIELKEDATRLDISTCILLVKLNFVAPKNTLLSIRHFHTKFTTSV